MEGSLPFISFVDLDKMVCMPEINLSKESGLPRAIQEVGDVGKWVEAPIINTVEGSHPFS